MLYEFAMTPDLFDESIIGCNPNAETILVQILRGIAENGLLANLHKDRWIKHIIQQRIPNLPQRTKDKIMSCLNVLESRHRLVRHPKSHNGDPANDIDWLNITLTSHAETPFHAIFLSHNLISNCGQTCNEFVEFGEALNTVQWNNRKRNVELRKTHDEYRNALGPILGHAKTLSLIDPYLNSQESRYFDTIDICSHIMGKRRQAGLHGRIHLHAEFRRQNPKNEAEFDCLNNWTNKLRPLVKRDGHSFTIFLWESFRNLESMHDRYIITDQCAISAPGGLDCRSRSHPNRTVWSLLDEENRRSILSDYDPNTGLFNNIQILQI